MRGAVGARVKKHIASRFSSTSCTHRAARPVAPVYAPPVLSPPVDDAGCLACPCRIGRRIDRTSTGRRSRRSMRSTEAVEGCATLQPGGAGPSLPIDATVCGGGTPRRNPAPPRLSARTQTRTQTLDPQPRQSLTGSGRRSQLQPGRPSASRRDSRRLWIKHPDRRWPLSHYPQSAPRSSSSSSSRPSRWA